MGVHYQLASRLAIMYAGKLVELADMSALVARPLHPYTALLIGSLPRSATARGARASAAGRRAPPTRRPAAASRRGARSRMAVCERVDPPVQELTPGHWVACHLHGEPGDGRPGHAAAARAPATPGTAA